MRTARSASNVPRQLFAVPRRRVRPFFGDGGRPPSSAIENGAWRGRVPTDPPTRWPTTRRASSSSTVPTVPTTPAPSVGRTPSATPATGPARMAVPSAMSPPQDPQRDRFDGLPAADCRSPQSKSRTQNPGPVLPLRGAQLWPSPDPLAPSLARLGALPWHAAPLAVPGTLPLTLLTGLFITVTDADRAPPGGR
jgi:hypothetical protein